MYHINTFNHLTLICAFIRFIQTGVSDWITYIYDYKCREWENTGLHGRFIVFIHCTLVKASSWLRWLKWFIIICLYFLERDPTKCVRKCHRIGLFFLDLEALLLGIERSHLRWFSIWLGCLPGEVFCLCPVGRRLWGRQRVRWRVSGYLHGGAGWHG